MRHNDYCRESQHEHVYLFVCLISYLHHYSTRFALILKFLNIIIILKQFHNYYAIPLNILKLKTTSAPDFS